MRFLPAVLISAFLCEAMANGQTRAAAVPVRVIHPDVAPAVGPPTLTALTVDIGANSLAWDVASQQIYLSLPSADGANGNAVQVLNPATGALGANIFAGSEPNLLAVSATSKYLYVSLNGASTVQRFTLPALGTDIKIALGRDSFDGPYFAADLQASPVADGTVAVVRDVSNVSPSEEGGVVIYDDGTARPNSLCGFIESGCTGSGGELFDSIQWNADASVMFASNDEDTGFDFYTIPVTASGFGKVTDYGGLSGSVIHFDKVTGYVYEDNGGIIDPIAGTKVGTFDASGMMVPDGTLGKAFFLSNASGTTLTVRSFDIRRLTPIATATISNVTGAPTHFIRWGSNGLAFTTAASTEFPASGSAVYILSGSFVGPGAGLLPSVNAGGAGPVFSSSNIVQPGQWISIFGTNLAGAPVSWSGNFVTSLGGTSVTIDGKPAYPSYVSPSQINVQVPDDAKTGPVSLVVTTGAGSGTYTVSLAPVSPSVPLLDSEHVAAVILRSDGSGAYGGGTYDIVGPIGTSLGYKTVAAQAGDVVALYAVGLGPTNPEVPAGKSFTGAAPTTNPVTLMINGVSVTPSFAGLSSAGLYQINFTVPEGLGYGDVPLQVVAAGMSSPTGDVISLQ